MEMNRDEIYEGLREIIPYLKRHYPTPRVCQESGMDALLDKLVIIQKIEEQELWNDYQSL